MEAEPLARIPGKTKAIKKHMRRPRLHSTWHLPNQELELILEDREGSNWEEEEDSASESIITEEFKETFDQDEPEGTNTRSESGKDLEE